MGFETHTPTSVKITSKHDHTRDRIYFEQKKSWIVGENIFASRQMSVRAIKKFLLVQENMFAVRNMPTRTELCSNAEL